MNGSLLKKPLIFVGPPRSGVSFISDMIFHHKDLCWLDDNFEKHPNSYFQHALFKFTSKCRSYLPNTSPRSLLHFFAKECSAEPSEALTFWDDATHEDIDFFRSFILKKQASPIEKAQIRETLSKRIHLSGKTKLALRFTGPGKIHWLKSLFPDAQFVHITRDPAATVHSLLSTEMWEYQGKHTLWWRDAYSEIDLNKYASLQRDSIASTAFQLHQLIKTTEQEALDLNVNMLKISYENFVSDPKESIKSIFNYADLPFDEKVYFALSKKNVKNKNKVLHMNEKDIFTAHQWCPSDPAAD